MRSSTRGWTTRGSVGRYAGFGPGQYTDFWGFLGLREGPVHFAGEHTSTFSQGFLNGGVESGERAAREVMNALGVTHAMTNSQDTILTSPE